MQYPALWHHECSEIGSGGAKRTLVRRGCERHLKIHACRTIGYDDYLKSPMIAPVTDLEKIFDRVFKHACQVLLSTYGFC